MSTNKEIVSNIIRKYTQDIKNRPNARHFKHIEDKYYKFQIPLIEKSHFNDINLAVYEWTVVGIKEDNDTIDCLCKYNKPKTIYQLYNNLTNKTIYTGIRCIHHFPNLIISNNNVKSINSMMYNYNIDRIRSTEFNSIEDVDTEVEEDEDMSDGESGQRRTVDGDSESDNTQRRDSESGQRRPNESSQSRRERTNESGQRRDGENSRSRTNNSRREHTNESSQRHFNENRRSRSNNISEEVDNDWQEHKYDTDSESEDSDNNNDSNNDNDSDSDHDSEDNDIMQLINNNEFYVEKVININRDKCTVYWKDIRLKKTNKYYIKEIREKYEDSIDQEIIKGDYHIFKWKPTKETLNNKLKRYYKSDDNNDSNTKRRKN